MLRATPRKEMDVVLLALHGAATEETGHLLPGLQETLDSGQTKIILNLGDVTYVNSAGLSRFIESYKNAIRKGATLALCNLQPHVLKVFKLARVEVFIPIYPSEAQAFRHFGVLVKENAEGPPREQILVVEPRAEIGDELTRLLTSQKEQLNYRLSRVPSVVEALKFVELRKVQVVVLDVTLPVKDCERLLSDLKVHPEHRRVPVIVATPDNRIADADWLIRNGADDLLRMPFSPYEVSSRLRTALMLHYALIHDDSQLSKLSGGRITVPAASESKYPTIH